MVEYDLRALSAPIEQLRTDVDAAYKRLDERWMEVAEALKTLPIPCDVAWTVSMNGYEPRHYHGLAWKKWNGKRRICRIVGFLEPMPDGTEEGNETITPYEEWSAEERVEMLKFVPNLFRQAERRTKAFIQNTQE